MTDTIKTILGVLAITVLLSTSYMLDGPDEVESARLDAQNLSDAQRMAKDEAELEAVAAAMCTKLNGPGYEHAWTQDNHLTCRPIKRLASTNQI